MRIIGGTYGGRKINVGKGFDSRPTTDFAREALFNILTNHFDFEKSKVLDLFGGTGSISFEFASRGCSEIDLVEINSRAVQSVEKFIEHLDIKAIRLVRMDVFRFIKVCRKQYDIIFADPPYDLKNSLDLPALIFSHQLLLNDGWFILEHDKRIQFKNHPGFIEERNYGSVHFSFFKA